LNIRKSARSAVDPEMHQAWEAEAQYEAQYKQAVDWANGISQQALVREFPELRSLPVAQWETTFGVIGQQDASRLQRGLGLIQNVVTASAEQTRPQNEQQAKQQAQQQEQVEKWARAKVRSTGFCAGRSPPTYRSNSRLSST
jgi:hypothetical protein